MRRACLALLALLAVPTAARAEGARKVVLVVSASSAEQVESVTNALRAQLGDLPTEVVVETPSPVPAELRARLDYAADACTRNDAVGAFFVEAERADDLLLYLVEPRARRALVRRVKKQAGAEQAGLEELGIIVRSSVGALLEGREIGMEAGPDLATPEPKPSPPPKPEPAPVAPRPAPPRAQEAPSTGRLAAHYAGQAFAAEVAWQSGLGVELAASPDRRWVFGLGYVALSPVEVESSAARVKVARHPLRGFAGYEVPAGGFRLGLELGLIGELDRRATTRTASGVEPTESADTWSAALSPRVTFRYPVWQGTEVWAGLGLDLFLNDSDYVAELAGRTETLLSPYRARAGAAMGLSVDLW